MWVGMGGRWCNLTKLVQFGDAPIVFDQHVIIAKLENSYMYDNHRVGGTKIIRDGPFLAIIMVWGTKIFSPNL